MFFPMSNKSTWMSVVLRSAVVSVAGACVAAFADLTPLGYLAGLFIFGSLAGAWGRRHGWLAGIVVGLSFSFLQLTRWAGPDRGSPDYWIIAVPTAVASTGMAILGSITGAWLQKKRLQRD
jgi:hypothetical protein